MLTTDRLFLREITYDDLDFISEMLAHPEVMYHYPKTYRREESKSWIQRQINRYSKDGIGLWLIEDRITREPYGQAGLIIQKVENSIETEIGYLLHRPYWGRGYATEVGLKAREYAFQNLEKDHVISLIRPQNLPSIKVAERLGMKPFRRTIFHHLEHIVFRVNRDQSPIDRTTEASSDS